MIKKQQYGGASLFVVIFTTLIVTITTVGFTQLMLRNQQQTTASDLSQRAYNSALAGVEDAKRVLTKLAKTCAADANTKECVDLKSAVDSQRCDTLQEAGIRGVDANGVYQETTVGAESDNQAYTCVKINMKTPNYEGVLQPDESTVVPLVGERSFDRVKLTWFTHADSRQPDINQAVSTYTSRNAGKLELPSQSEWSTQYPPIMRTQYIPNETNAARFDSSARTAFLYPLGTVPLTVAMNNDNRRSATNVTPSPTGCSLTYATATGACSAEIVLPARTSSAYMQLMPLYNGTHFTIELCNGACSGPASHVDFNGVQPIVDSTGRAAELFRRIAARVKVSGVSLPYPGATMTTKGDLCKDFSLRDSDGNSYNPSTTGEACDPMSGI